MSDNSGNNVLSGIIITLLVGLFLLILEHRTNLFARAQGPLDLRPGLRLWSAFARSVRSVLNRSGTRLFFLIALGVSVAVINVLLSTPEAATYSVFNLVLIVLLFVIAAMFVFVNNPPGNYIGFILTIVDLLAVSILLFWFTEYRSDGAWPAKLSPIDMTNPRTIGVIVVTITLAVMWVASTLILSHVSTVEARLDRKIMLLANMPEISAWLEDQAAKRIDYIMMHWAEFLDILKKTDQWASGAIYDCVPVEFKGDTLILGCRTQKEVDIFKNPIRRQGGSEPAPKYKVEQTIREFISSVDVFKYVGVSVVCVVIEEDRYKDIKNKLNRMN